MKTILRRISISVGRGHGSWLTLLLLLVVLVPSASLLWFMNQAVRNERLAVRQKLVDAYRGQLSLAQERLEKYWKQAAEELEAERGKFSAPGLFARQVRAGLADAVVCFDSDGTVIYPDTLRPGSVAALPEGWSGAQRLEAGDPAGAASAYARLAEEATNTDLAARALRAQARCLLQAGRKAEAVSVLTGPLAEERYLLCTDSDGRLLAPSAELMAVELLNESAPDQARVLFGRLRQQLLDYEGVAMPAPQRRFLMHEVQRQFPGEAMFPTLEAEELAARYVEVGLTEPRAAVMRPSSLPGIWQFGSRDGLVVTLHRTESLLVRMGAAVGVQTLPPDVRLDLVVPGREAEGSLLSLPAGPTFPAWHLGFSLRDQGTFDAATHQRITFYVWSGALVVSTVIVLAVLALGLVRRQLALTRLRNDLVANVTHELKTPLSSMRLFVETLLNSPRLHEPTVREYLQLIAGENIRLSRLIDNFLTFSRIERRKYNFDFKEVPAGSIVEGAVAAVRERFQSPGCRFQVESAEGLPRVLADTDAMVMVLVNLLDNAYKYTGETKLITLAAGAGNGDVTFAVKDNGIGLSARDRKRIFKRFYQVDQNFRVEGGAGWV